VASHGGNPRGMREYHVGLREREDEHAVRGDDGHILLPALALVRHRICVGLPAEIRDPE
jgi:hypothetical protein